MRSDRLRLPPLAALAVLGAIALAGCATAEAEPGAGKFLRAHEGEVRHTAEVTKTVEADVAGLSRPPSTAQLQALALAIHHARRAYLAAASWAVSENGEEEDIVHAEQELNEAAGAMLKAFTELRVYTQARRPAALAIAHVRIAEGRENWNQGITHLWYLAHRSGAPTI